MKKATYTGAKIVFTGALVWYFLTKIDLRAALEIIEESNPLLFAAAALAMLAVWLFTTLRWQAILNIMGISVSAFRLFLYNLIGNFYGIVLPGGRVSGDIMCAYRFTKEHAGGVHTAKYFLGVFADRFIAVFTLLIVLSVYVLSGHSAMGAFGPYAPAVGGAVLLATMAGFLLIFTSAFDFLPRVLGRIPLRPLERLGTSLLKGLAVSRAHAPAMLWATLLGVGSVVLNFAVFKILALAVGLALPFWTIGFAYVGATLLISVPVTVAGIGLREGALVYLLTRSGGALAPSVALSILTLALLALFAAAGGAAELYFAFRKRTALPDLGTAPPQNP